MAEDGPSTLTETIGLIFRAMRGLLVVLNSVIILFALFFVFSGKNLGGEKLQMVPWLRWIYCLTIISTAIYGIVVSLWTGKKCKFHLKMIMVYLILIALLTLIGIILSAVYVRKPTKYDIIFIVGSCFIMFILTTTTITFGYALKKTKLFRRMNMFSSS